MNSAAQRTRWLAAVVPPAVVFVAALLAAEVLLRVSNVPMYLLVPPSEVLRTLGAPEALLPPPVPNVRVGDSAAADARELWAALWATGLSALAGFALSGALGLLVAVGLSSSAWVQRALYPYAVFFQTVPIIAIAPLLVIWIGWGTPTVVASAFIVSVFPVIANTLTGLRSTDPALRDLFRLYGASPLAALLKLRLPFALPSIMTGLRVAAGLAVIGAIVGEFITGGGLGGVMDAARTQQRVDKVFAGLLLASLLGLTLFGLVNLISRLTLRHWHASEQA